MTILIIIISLILLVIVLIKDNQIHKEPSRDYNVIIDNVIIEYLKLKDRFYAYPEDNSYIENLTGKITKSLAGSIYTDAEEVLVISKPFKDHKYDHEFILVKDNKEEIYKILNYLTTKEESIKRKEQLRQHFKDLYL